VTPSALVVDDDPAVRFTVRQFLEDMELTVHEADSGEAALAHDDLAAVDVLVVDLRMGGMDGLTLLERLGSTATRAVVLTAHGSEREAVAAMKLGARDYLTKPFDPDAFREVIERVVEPIRVRKQAEALSGQLHLARTMAFRSSAMQELAVLVHRVASKDVTVLIQGESGTGKERVAEALVSASSRAVAPFVRFNCAALSPELIEAELFGHEAGAFTHAERARQGLFREADGGTILLDEVAELDERAQAKLLRVLQEKEVRPVGADRAVEVDVRILASTHRDLRAAVDSGRFREDLFYRLRVVMLSIPPLRDRPEDIRPLAEHFLRLYAQRFGMRATPSEALFQRLEGWHWPGNVRELENSIESMLAMSPSDDLDLSLLPGPDTGQPERRAGLKERMMAFERGQIVSALEVSRHNQAEAARLLGIGKATLHDKMKKHGL
jgi:DNA-binding NtrC family response regulator